MSKLPAYFTTGVGRIVGGSVFEGKSTDMEGNPLVQGKGTANEKPRTEYFIRVAFDKTDPKTNDMLGYMFQVAAEAWPSMFAAGQWPERFSNKIHDGDDATPDKNGNPKNQREGYAGHWLVDFKQPTTLPQVVDEARNPITDPDRSTDFKYDHSIVYYVDNLLAKRDGLTPEAV